MDEEYECIGSWEEGDTTFTYLSSSLDGAKGCFASKQDKNGELWLAWTGKNCDRKFDFYSAPKPGNSERPTLFHMKLETPCLAVTTTKSTTVTETELRAFEVGREYEDPSPPIMRVRTPTSGSDIPTFPTLASNRQALRPYNAHNHASQTFSLFHTVILFLLAAFSAAVTLGF